MIKPNTIIVIIGIACLITGFNLDNPTMLFAGIIAFVMTGV